MSVPPTSFGHIQPTLEQIMRAQSRVFRARDVSAWLSTHDIRREIEAGRWQRPHRGVYVAHNGALTLEQERWVCLFAAPAGSALGGLTAAELDGFQGFAVPETHLVVPAGFRRPVRRRLVAKLSTRLDADDVHPLHLPRRTRLPRSLVDAASWMRHDRHARAVILAGVQQRLVRCGDLRDALSRRGPCLRHALIIETIGDAEGGIASVPEHDFEQVRRAHSLPVPKRQAIMRRSDGRYYLDADWPEYGVAAEIHGMQHLEITNWDVDLDRQSVIAARGRRLLQFTSYAVRHHQARVAAVLAVALRNGGWRQ